MSKQLKYNKTTKPAVANLRTSATQVQTPAKHSPASEPQAPLPQAAKGNGVWRNVHAGKKRLGHPTYGRLDRADLKNGARLVRGCEKLSTVSLPSASTPIGSSLLTGKNQVFINPKALGKRLPLEAIPFAKFRFSKLRFEYIPAVTDFTAATGDIILGFNVDPASPMPPRSADGIESVVTWDENKISGTSNRHMNLEANLSLTTQADLFVESTEESRFSSQGYLIVLAESSFTTSQLALGHVYLHYELELYEPNLPNDVTTTVIAATQGVAPLATGGAFFNATTSFAGSTDLLTSLAAGAAGPQFLINVDAPGDPQAMEIHMFSKAASPGATITIFPQMTLTPPPLSNGFAGFVSGGINPFAADSNQISDRLVGSTNPQNVGGGVTSASDLSMTTWRFVIDRPTLLEFTSPSVSAGEVDWKLVITKLDPDFDNRQRAHAPFLTLSQMVNIDGLLADQTVALSLLKELLGEFVKETDQGLRQITGTDYAMLNAFHAAISTPLPKDKPTAVPLFLPLLAGAAAWLIGKFGPSIASHVLGYGVKKLTEYAHGKTEDASERERKRARRSQKREEDETPDV